MQPRADPAARPRLVVPEGLVIDDSARARLERRLALAPESVDGVGAAASELAPGASYRVHAEWTALDTPESAALVSGGASLRGAVLVRRGKGGKRREVGMDRWAWEQLEPRLEIRQQLPIGVLLCVMHGPTAGRCWEASAARKQLHHAAAGAGVRRRFAPHQLRHAHAVEMAHEGVPLVVIQRQLGHANLGITSIYLQGIDSSEIISTVHGRPSPTISASAGLMMRR